MRIKIQIFEQCSDCSGTGQIPTGYILGTLATLGTPMDNTYPEMKSCNCCKGKGKLLNPQFKVEKGN